MYEGVTMSGRKSYAGATRAHVPVGANDVRAGVHVGDGLPFDSEPVRNISSCSLDDGGHRWAAIVLQNGRHIHYASMHCKMGRHEKHNESH